MKQEKLTETWISLVRKEFDEEKPDLNELKISIMDSVSHSASFFDLKSRLEDTLNRLLSQMKANEFFRRFSAKQ